jgi:L-lactate dehydrogenase complex protein LldE
MSARIRVGLFVTCLVDLVRPQVGFAAVKLLEQASCDVAIPRVQTCCGQPAWNAGADQDARDIARKVIAAFEVFDYVVAPSGSCAGMIKRHYPEMFENDPLWLPRARALAAKTHELMSFLVHVRGIDAVRAKFAGSVCYHDSCSSRREMGVVDEPRQLLASVDGLTLKEIADKESCCGFGGLFSVKYPEISERIADTKIADVLASGAETLTGGDLGCLLHLAGRMKRDGKDIAVRHVAEILADMGEDPALGQPAK